MVKIILRHHNVALRVTHLFRIQTSLWPGSFGTGGTAICFSWIIALHLQAFHEKLFMLSGKKEKNLLDDEVEIELGSQE